ncbi:MAG TPA: M14 metallopeptidase family protein [Vicinamibacterales bacterium]|nr:M14 metallopeptidase family protein [Vicinamibacterales bacterium]
MLTKLFALVAVVSAIAVASPQAQTSKTPKITTPKQFFGHDIGDDYYLANYTQYVEYLHKVDQESDRMTVIDIGKTEEGRPELTAIITSPENHRKLAQLKEANRKLALADGITDEQAHQLALAGKSVVWIDGGLHATEVLGAQQLIETIYRLNSKTDPETMRILNDDIILCTLINPDGMELVSNWYMREPDEKKRTTQGIPRLYEKYIGHDDNRDFYMMNMSESTNANKVMYREWYPVIMYNHHQTGPAGAVLFAPPFRDPFNYNFDPLVVLGIDTVGSAIHTRLAAENKPGAVMRSGAPYSTWFNGGIRTTSYFHNQIGILTESIGNPTPVEIPFVLEMQLPRADVPNPIAPQTWHFRQSIEYSVTMNYAVLDIASKRHEDFLYDMYKMAKNAIDKGNRDTWTIHPKRIEAARVAIEAAQGRSDSGSAEGPRAALGGRGGGGGRGAGAPVAVYNTVLHDPKMRDPRGFILPSDQPDFLTATKFMNILIKAGVTVQRATAPFTVNGKSYPVGSYVVKAAQPFRAHVMDMFEPQDHPDDIPYPGGAPRPPYDVTGYNLSYSMGVKFDRILDAFDGPFQTVRDLIPVPAGTVTAAPNGGGYLLSHQVNDAAVAVNRLLKANEDVYWLASAVTANGKTYPTGTIYVAARPTTLAILQKVAADKGVSADAVAAKPAADAIKLKPVRIGLWDQYGGSMPSGWTRWILEQYEFPFEVVYPQTLDAGNLNAKFDVLVFVDGAIPARDPSTAAGQAGGGGFGAQPAADTIPAEFRPWLGRVTVAKTIPALKTFAENGGTIITIGSSTTLAYHFGLPIKNALAEIVNGVERPLPREKYYVPGSILDARVDTSAPLAYGMEARTFVMFDESPAFRLEPEATLKGIRPILWYDSPTPLRSGWAWGQQYLNQAVAIADAPVGKGRLVLFGPEVLWRAQPHATFKLFFNAIFDGAAAGGSSPVRTSRDAR